jgi:endonuclease/exonuclease/phosphatase family metal-dependent hydrolase
MAKLCLGSFNCENLFARFKFNKNVDPAKVTKNGFTVNETYFDILREEEKRLTAEVIKALDADVLALQEVENLEVLKRFRSERLKGLDYTYAMLIDGNDPRHIDVAVLSRYPIVAARSHQHLRAGKSFVFSRDCLEVDLDVGGKPLTLFVNHFKSMLDKGDPKNGRKNTRAKRLLQAKTVRDLIQNRFGNSLGNHPWAVLGDLNDYRDPGQGTTSGILDLTDWTEVENVVDRLPPAERWTHFYDAAKANETAYRQIDYILLSKSLAGATTAQPIIERRGLSPKATQATQKRFKGVTAKTVASDHCAVAIDVELQ